MIALGVPFPLFGADNVRGKLIVFNDDGGWSWFMDERAIVDPIRNTLIVNSVASSPVFSNRNGDIEGVEYDVATGARRRFTLADNFEEDDHDAAGLVILPDGRYLAVYARHGSTVESLGDYVSRSRVSTNAGDVSAWDPEVAFDWQTTPFNDYEVSYSNVYHLSSESRTYNIARVTHRSPNLAVSDDLGQSWSYGGQLTSGQTTGYSNGYFKFASNGVDRIYFAGTEQHPRDFNNSVYAGYITGGKSYRMDGSIVDENVFDSDNADPSVLSPATNTFTLVMASDPENGMQRATRFWTADMELDASGNPCVLFTARADDVPVNTNGYADHVLFYACWDGAAWTAHQVAAMGGQLTPSEQDYTGVGALVPGNTSTIFVSTPVSPIDQSVTTSHEIYKGVTTDGGATFTWTAITSGSASDNLRPIVPAWDTDHTAVLWLRGSMRSSQNYDAAIVGVVENRLESLGRSTYVDATPNNTALSDGAALVATGPSGDAGAVDSSWHWKSGVGNGASVLSSSEAGYENAPPLRTQLRDLPDGTYDIFAYFWAENSADWYLQAGFQPEALVLFRSNRSTIGLLAATTADNVQQAESRQFASEDVTLESGGAFLYRAHIGRRVVTGSASIDVIIDDYNNPSFSDDMGARLGRTWYDGVGYARVGAPGEESEDDPLLASMPDAGAPTPPAVSTDRSDGGCAIKAGDEWGWAGVAALVAAFRRRRRPLRQQRDARREPCSAAKPPNSSSRRS